MILPVTADLAVVPTPFGAFSVLAADGAVLASGWTRDTDALLAPVARALRPAHIRQRRDLGDITDAVRAYARGDLCAIDQVPVLQRSGPFLEHAWDVLRTLVPGGLITYAQLAESCGARPGSARAAAQACGRNAVALFVPCHRVARSDGSLGGFRWGLETKRALLAHEARPALAH